MPTPTRSPSVFGNCLRRVLGALVLLGFLLWSFAAKDLSLAQPAMPLAAHRAP